MMAQHVETKYFPQKKFREIEESINKAFENLITIRGSLKWEEDRDKTYSEHDDDLVFFTERTIPDGIVYGSNRGSFEVHFNEKTREVEKIYLVA